MAQKYVVPISHYKTSCGDVLTLEMRPTLTPHESHCVRASESAEASAASVSKSGRSESESESEDKAFFFHAGLLYERIRPSGLVGVRSSVRECPTTA